jgi:hypothetical protein
MTQQPQNAASDSVPLLKIQAIPRNTSVVRTSDADFARIEFPVFWNHAGPIMPPTIVIEAD